MKTDDGRLYVIAGASRSGKTAWTSRQVAKLPRVLVWDVEDQWSTLSGFRRIATRADLLAAVKKPGNARLAYVAGGDIKAEFDFWAGCAFFWARHVGPCVIVAEELADVTSQAKAPGNWGIVLRRGLKRGMSIYAISQRWAEADKTAVGNASEFVLFRMSSADDIAYMSRKTRVPREKLDSLIPVYGANGRVRELPYIRFTVTGELIEERLKFGN